MIIDDVDKIIKEQVYAFERLIRFCLFNYEEESKKFLNELAVIIYNAHVKDGEELRRLITLGDILNGELNREDLYKKVQNNPNYVIDLLNQYKLLANGKMIFPYNRIKVYHIEGDKIKSKIEEKAIKSIRDRKGVIKSSLRLNDNVLMVSVGLSERIFYIGNKKVENACFLCGLEGNYLTDCPYTLKSMKFLVKHDERN